MALLSKREKENDQEELLKRVSNSISRGSEEETKDHKYRGEEGKEIAAKREK